MFLWISIFVVSMFVLLKAADYFTDSAEKIGLYFGLSPFIIGVTIVAIGTSLPELISSIVAVLNGSSEIVVGNVIGSNITNIFLVLAVAAIAGKKLKISYELVHVDLPMLLSSAFLLALTIWDGVFTFPEAILCIAGIVLYSLYTISSEARQEDKEVEKEIKKIHKMDYKTILVLLGSSFFVFIGAKYTIDSVIELSKIFAIGTEIIAITVVALGTSLPELVVTYSAAKKGNSEMAIGNVLGSNIFNTFGVMGFSALFGNLVIPESILIFGLPVMLIATFLYFFITHDKEITRWEGWILLLFYVFFIGKVIGLV